MSEHQTSNLEQRVEEGIASYIEDFRKRFHVDPSQASLEYLRRLLLHIFQERGAARNLTTPVPMNRPAAAPQRRAPVFSPRARG